MGKDFLVWHKQKSALHADAQRVFFHEREVWWCSLGVNVGFEQDGKGEYFDRPVLIFKKFNKEVFWGIPFSTKIKKGSFYLPVFLHHAPPQVAILSQLRLLDAKRLLSKLGTIEEAHFLEVQKAVVGLCRQ